mgnify:CR=1 FL=1
MSHIAIRHSHSLTVAQARQAAEALAAQLADRYAVRTYWEEDTLHFERLGINGQLLLEPGQIVLDAHLGFLFAPLQLRLEQEIYRHLDEIFQEPHPA